jgi:hypothetical protein
MFGDYLLECFETLGLPPIIDMERQIICGNEYFRSKDPLEQGETFLMAYSLWLIQ